MLAILSRLMVYAVSGVLIIYSVIAFPAPVTKQAIETKQAPAPIGSFSQAIQVGNIVYLSGQIAMDPNTGKLAEGIAAQTEQVFKNLAAVASASGGSLAQVVKLNVFLTDLNNVPVLNATMAKYFAKPYPARSTVGVTALPKGAAIEVEGIMIVSSNKAKPTIN